MRRLIIVLLAFLMFSCNEEETTIGEKTEPEQPESFMDYFGELTPEDIVRDSDGLITEKEIQALTARRKRGDWLILDKDTANHFINLQYKSTGNNIAWKLFLQDTVSSIFLRSMGEDEPWWEYYIYDQGDWTLAMGDLPVVTVGDFLDTATHLYKKESFSDANVGVVPYFDEEKRLSFRLQIPVIMDLADSLYVKFVPERDIVRTPHIDVDNGALTIDHTPKSSDWEPSYRAVFAFHSGEDLPGWDNCIQRIKGAIDGTDIKLLIGKSYEKSILIDIDKGPLVDISGITGEDEVFEGYILIQEGSRNRYVPYGSCGTLIARMKHYFGMKDEEKE